MSPNPIDVNGGGNDDQCCFKINLKRISGPEHGKIWQINKAAITAKLVVFIFNYSSEASFFIIYNDVK